MPSVVMNIRYVGQSAIKAQSHHEKHRTPDGASAIDPARSHLNKVLRGPVTQSEALERLWSKGVKPPATQSETPYVQMVLSASPEFFRDPGQGPGQWNKRRMREWGKRTFDWLREEYGADLVHASIHLDEDTPHIHALVVPTYQKKPRKPGRQKRGETLEEFEARKAEAENAETVRTVGRSSNETWRKSFARRDARRSYHKAVEGLGIEYGRDFLGEGMPSPDHKATGTWVKEQAAEVVAAREAVKKQWIEADKMKQRLTKLLDQAQSFLARPDLPKAARIAGAALMRAAGRPVIEPGTGQSGGGLIGKHISRPANNPRPEPPAPVIEDSGPSL